jgi:DNA-binding LytR/AlgR family response regulator
LKSVKDAVEYFKNNSNFDLIISDIQLGDGLCFEIFKEIQLVRPVIFCTAYDVYALEAFNANGIDYILKPFTKQSVEGSLKKFEFLTDFSSKKLNNLLQYMNIQISEQELQTILVYQGAKIIPL